MGFFMKLTSYQYWKWNHKVWRWMKLNITSQLTKQYFQWSHCSNGFAAFTEWRDLSFSRFLPNFDKGFSLHDDTFDVFSQQIRLWKCFMTNRTFVISSSFMNCSNMSCQMIFSCTSNITQRARVSLKDKIFVERVLRIKLNMNRYTRVLRCPKTHKVPSSFKDHKWHLEL